MTDPEPFIKEYGEKWRELIINALKFLDDNEPKWNLRRSSNRARYIKSVMKDAKRK